MVDLAPGFLLNWYLLVVLLEFNLETLLSLLHSLPLLLLSLLAILMVDIGLGLPSTNPKNSFLIHCNIGVSWG